MPHLDKIFIFLETENAVENDRKFEINIFWVIDIQTIVTTLAKWSISPLTNFRGAEKWRIRDVTKWRSCGEVKRTPNKTYVKFELPVTFFSSALKDETVSIYASF